jgi:hypothetical protein
MYVKVWAGLGLQCRALANMITGLGFYKIGKFLRYQTLFKLSIRDSLTCNSLYFNAVKRCYAGFQNIKTDCKEIVSGDVS